MTRPALDLVIFDCDGTLIDSEPIAARTLAAILTEAGFPITPQACDERFVGLSLAQVATAVEADRGRPLPAGLWDELARRDRIAFEAELRVIPGIHDALDGLSAAMCVASSSSLEQLRFTLGLTKLWERFAPHIFSASMVARGKPAPDLFLFAAQRMGAHPDRCVVIEDSVRGVTAGRAAGMTVLGFTGGGHCDRRTARRLRAAGAVRTFSRMDRLPGLLGRLVPARP